MDNKTDFTRDDQVVYSAFDIKRWPEHIQTMGQKVGYALYWAIVYVEMWQFTGWCDG